ncbi:helix-turn-helix domain-containing protein [Pseudomonas sp. NPDC007930]|uniref:helix-turn-helix domain-containing protein n=1 Tax=Pseudomonas sp. NPDC007930 TaxID=3364417 RepID=UPI0036E127F0
MPTKPSLDARSLDHRVLEALRLRAVAAIEQGCSVAQVATAMGLNRRTVFRWVADYRRGGAAALLAKPIPGRPRRLPGTAPDQGIGP